MQVCIAEVGVTSVDPEPTCPRHQRAMNAGVRQTWVSLPHLVLISDMIRLSSLAFLNLALLVY